MGLKNTGRQAKINQKVAELLDEKRKFTMRGLSRELAREYKGVKPNCLYQQIVRAKERYRSEHKAQSAPKRLFYDIETSMGIGWVWRAGWKQRISPKQLIIPKKIICVSYKWEGEDKVHHLKWDDGCDMRLVADFVEVLSKADEIVAHNGDRFDIKEIRTRAINHRIEMNPHMKSIDTVKWARSHFSFNSNKLDEIAKELNVGQKIPTQIELWTDIVLAKRFPELGVTEKQSKESMKQMLEYCDMDVVVLEDVFHVMKNYIKPTFHHGVLKTGDKYTCPETGTIDLTYLRPRVTAAGTIKYQFQSKGGKFLEMNRKDYIDWFQETHRHKRA